MKDSLTKEDIQEVVGETVAKAVDDLTDKLEQLARDIHALKRAVEELAPVHPASEVSTKVRHSR